MAEAAGEELLWIQPAARTQSHELRTGDEIVATLRRQRQTLADADSADVRWTNFWHSQREWSVVSR